MHTFSWEATVNCFCLPSEKKSTLKERICSLSVEKTPFRRGLACSKANRKSQKLPPLAGDNFLIFPRITTNDLHCIPSPTGSHKSCLPWTIIIFSFFPESQQMVCIASQAPLSIMKTRLFKYTENFSNQIENFQIKNSDIFHISAQNIDCGYSLEMPC